MTRGAEVELSGELRSRLRAERRRRSIEYGYRVCGLWWGDDLGDAPRVCVMPSGHQTSPHRDADGCDFEPDRLHWLG